MFAFKKKYYLFVENTREFKLDLIKTREKFNIIYRNQNTKEKIQDLFNYRKKCAKYGIKFYVANNTSLLIRLRADGLYISSHNKSLLLNSFIKKGFDVIG